MLTEQDKRTLIEKNLDGYTPVIIAENTVIIFVQEGEDAIPFKNFSTGQEGAAFYAEVVQYMVNGAEQFRKYQINFLFMLFEQA